MVTLRLLEDLRALGAPLHLALGVFDGLHVGHQAVIQRAVAAAQREGGLAGVLSFHPNPAVVLAPSLAPTCLISNLGEKERLIAATGVDFFLPLKFDAKLAQQSAEEFIEALIDQGVKTIIVGEDWRFGRRRAGNIELLRSLQARLGYRVEPVTAIESTDGRVSSTRIREAVGAGDLKTAASLLGRPYRVCGEVIRGDQRGRQLGFPTANIALSANVQLPPDGVWEVDVKIPANQVSKRAIANLGVRPTFGKRERLLEVHIPNFSGDLYDQELKVDFRRFLRGEQKFSSPEALRQQIALDVASLENSD